MSIELETLELTVRLPRATMKKLLLLAANYQLGLDNIVEVLIEQQITDTGRWKIEPDS